MAGALRVLRKGADSVLRVVGVVLVGILFGLVGHFARLVGGGIGCIGGGAAGVCGQFARSHACVGGGGLRFHCRAVGGLFGRGGGVLGGRSGIAAGLLGVRP